jgi:hypothetical protein
MRQKQTQAQAMIARINTVTTGTTIAAIRPALMEESSFVGLDVLALDWVRKGDCVLVGVRLLDLDRVRGGATLRVREGVFERVRERVALRVGEGVLVRVRERIPERLRGGVTVWVGERVIVGVRRGVTVRPERVGVPHVARLPDRQFSVVTLTSCVVENANVSKSQFSNVRTLPEEDWPTK